MAKYFKKGEPPVSHKTNCKCFRCDKNFVHTKEHNLHVSLAKKGKKRPDMIGNKFGIESRTGDKCNFWNGGKPKCLECSKEIFYTNKRCWSCFVNFCVGINHPQWRGGITPINNKIRTSMKYKNWAKMVKERDNFECQICGIKGGFLHSNHIKKFADYPEFRFTPTNGITICRNCDNFWVKNREEEWESYFNFNLMTRRVI